MEKVNKKLKSIYFQWAINYAGPPPRSFASTFEEHLEFEYYEFDENWLHKIINECSIESEQEFQKQVVLVENDYSKYWDQQSKKRDKNRNKKTKKEVAEDVLPF